jgi:DNA-binding XRE family transcriptional regulator
MRRVDRAPLSGRWLTAERRAEDVHPELGADRVGRDERGLGSDRPTIGHEKSTDGGREASACGRVRSGAGFLSGLTREELARRIGTSVSAISRVERGRHDSSPRMVRRLAAGLEMRFLVGLEHGSAEKPVRRLVPFSS